MSKPDKISELSDNLTKLSERISKIYAYRAVFARGIVNGIGTAIGATIIATLLIFIFLQFFDLVGLRSLIENYLSLSEILESELL
jgi:hypothetical protein